MPRVQLKFSYTVPELSSLVGMSRYRCEKMLATNGVKLHKTGVRKRVVLLSQIRKYFPDFWDSMIELIRLGSD